MFSLPLLDFKRPVVELYGMEALIDTGALVPVISMPAKVVEKVFSAEKVNKKDLSLGGIGGRATGDVYRLPEFVFGDIRYSPFEVFVPRVAKISFPILLGATLFYNMSYTVDTVDNQFIVDIKDAPLNRRFKLLDLQGELYPQIDDTLIQDGSILIEDLAIYSNFSIG